MGVGDFAAHLVADVQHALLLVFTVSSYGRIIASAPWSQKRTGDG
jgi:hypothetical protein